MLRPSLGIKLQLAVPEDADEKVFYRALDLIGKHDFRQARSRLWSWENELPADFSLDDAQRCLQAQVGDYHATVEKVKRRFPALTGKAVRAGHHPGSAIEGMLSVVAR